METIAVVKDNRFKLDSKSMAMGYVLAICSLLRIYFFDLVGIWFPSKEMLDDDLMVEYATGYYDTFPGVYSLVKTKGFPLFLRFVNFTRLDYGTVLSIVWIVAALLVYRLMHKLTRKRSLSLLAFLYVLFYPTAFELWLGTRLYRNSIIIPFLIILFYFALSMTLRIFHAERRLPVLICNAILLGACFSFVYYIKEDGAWLLACMLALSALSLLMSIIRGVRRNDKATAKRTLIYSLILLIPFAIFAGTTQCYKAVNYRKFGVSEIETRTQGEIGKFCKIMISIDAEGRTGDCWVPKDALDKAFAASKTLSEHQGLEEAILQYTSEPFKPNIQGDFLSWDLRSALTVTGMWQSESQMQAFFHQVNEELEIAFADGTLQKSSRFQLVSSMGGRTKDEILDLIPAIMKQYNGVILLHGYTAGSGTGDSISDPSVSRDAADVANTPYLVDYSLSGIDHEGINRVINTLFDIYRMVNILLLLISIMAFIYGVVYLISHRNKKKSENVKFQFYLFALSITMGLAGAAYSLAIAWFTGFINVSGYNYEIVNFYNLATVVFQIYIFIFSFVFLHCMKREKQKEMAG